MAYRVSPSESGQIFQTHTWSKDDHTVTITIQWNWGSVVVEDQPDLSSYNPDRGIEVYTSFPDCDPTLNRGINESYSFSSSMSDGEIEEVEDFIERNSADALYELDWELDDVVIYFKGPLAIKEI